MIITTREIKEAKWKKHGEWYEATIRGRLCRFLCGDDGDRYADWVDEDCLSNTEIERLIKRRRK